MLKLYESKGEASIYIIITLLAAVATIVTCYITIVDHYDIDINIFKHNNANNVITRHYNPLNKQEIKNTNVEQSCDNTKILNGNTARNAFDENVRLKNDYIPPKTHYAKNTNQNSKTYNSKKGNGVIESSVHETRVYDSEPIPKSIEEIPVTEYKANDPYHDNIETDAEKVATKALNENGLISDEGYKAGISVYNKISTSSIKFWNAKNSAFTVSTNHSDNKAKLEGHHDFAIIKFH